MFGRQTINVYGLSMCKIRYNIANKFGVDVVVLILRQPTVISTHRDIILFNGVGFLRVVAGEHRSEMRGKFISDNGCLSTALNQFTQNIRLEFGAPTLPEDRTVFL